MEVNLYVGLAETRKGSFYFKLDCGDSLPEEESAETVDPGEETRLMHERYLAAINNPLRKKILEALKTGILSGEELRSKTELTQEALNWHLSVLENVCCIQIESGADGLFYKLTKAGRVVEYLE